MRDIILKTLERKTSVTREAVRAAVAEAFKDYKKDEGRPGAKGKAGANKKAA